MKLTSAKRNKLPKKEFGMPGEKKYPMSDKIHAANAKGRAAQMVKKGKLSETSKEKIDAKANKILGERKYSKPGPKTVLVKGYDRKIGKK